jgi:hypothetical protein
VTRLYAFRDAMLKPAAKRPYAAPRCRCSRPLYLVDPGVAAQTRGATDAAAGRH